MYRLGPRIFISTTALLCAAVFIPILSWLMRLAGYRTTSFWTGVGVGVIVMLAEQFLRRPPEVSSLRSRFP